MAGIVRYGSYVPYFRLQRSAMGGGKGERAIASFDEDSVSMAVEAAREVLAEGGAAEEIDTLLFASTSAPYSEKLNAATVHAACSLPAAVSAFDLTGSTRAGVGSLLAGADMAAGGRRVLVCVGDVVVGAPEGPRERAGGDAAAAFLMGDDQDAIARVIGRASMTEEVLDVWRSAEMPFARQWEDRFGADVLVPVLREVITRALKSAGLQPADLATLIVDSSNARSARVVLRSLALKPEQVADPLESTVGRAGAAHCGLLLARALDRARPGDRIGVVCAADGAEAVILEVGEDVARGRPGRTVDRWIESRRNDVRYTSYLKWRGVLPFEPPRRPDPERPGAPPMRRVERWKYGFVGTRCTRCQTVNLPPQRVCVACGAVDQVQPEPFADATGRIATFAIDHLAYSLQPPNVVAVVDFDKGGRFTTEVTDVDPDKVAVGDELEMTFRRFFTAGGVHNYFWKARPKR